MVSTNVSIPARLLAIALPMVLVGCGGGATMTSYDAEKSRIREALTSEVDCIETPVGGGTRLECRSGNEAFRLFFEAQSSSGPMRLELALSKNAIASRTAESFWRVLSAYGFEDTDVEKCLGTTDAHNKQLATHRVYCDRGSDGLVARVSQQKAV